MTTVPDSCHLNRDALLHSQDLDETRRLVASVFCEHRLELRQAATRLDYRHQHLRTEQLSFSSMRYGAEVHIRPGELGSFYLVQLPFAGHDRQRIGRRELLSDSLHGSIHAPDESLEMNWSGDCQKLVVRIERGALERHAGALLDHDLRQPLAFHPLMDLRNPAGAVWGQTARQLFDVLQRAPQLFEMPLVRAQFEQTLMTTLLTWQPNSLSERLGEPSAQVLPRHVKRAVDYIQAHAEQPISVETLAAIAGVSGRSIYHGFQRFLGVSPMRYLRDVRMERVHQDLKDPRQPARVTEILARWGFFQFGRFAIEYRQRYAETPRQTLARGRA
ncbi:AraC family transcriptional regulator [Pseudomonas citronellolis]|uniref:AraC family transcriptional regulator n=1 Tax=Pseudomonas citronellolis TaxID=53408 RepID=UPI0021BE4D87|nr:AraC family transcriptional regulator [Pseudomonas citronellolis]UXJ50040.1 AraC family transcriptional regulator [Pseudomonas citronellolis]